MVIEWSEQYATGVAAIDGQHRHLFALVNDLERRLKRGAPIAELNGVVEALATYAGEHFACEEDLMDRCGCATACVNKLAHGRFGRLVGQTVAEMRAGRLARPQYEALSRECQSWLHEHICRVDIKLREAAVARS
jgi:hemerythrin